MEKVIDILKKFTEFDEGSVTPETSLQGDLGLNSLDLVNMVMEFEDAYGIEIPESDIVGLVTVGDVEKYLSEKIG